MALLDPDTAFEIQRLEAAHRLRQQAHIHSVSEPRKSLMERVREYWQQIRPRPVTQLHSCEDCCAGASPR